MLYASGTGGPVVVFLPGGGMTGLGYLYLHEQASRFTTSVLYDRAGTGWSDQAALPRSATEVTDELRSRLRVAGVPAPYVFVGHSLGGIYARRFAQRFPADVAGLATAALARRPAGCSNSVAKALSNLAFWCTFVEMKPGRKPQNLRGIVRWCT
jgi:pimeloyl-ACP methyl ester carboxylesterase